jgi:hypothetical protein
VCGSKPEYWDGDGIGEVILKRGCYADVVDGWS